MDQRAAFTRAWRFLNFKPVAKWTALTAAVAIGLVTVALLVVLGLFADLVVYRGHAPTFANLGTMERDSYFDNWSRLEPKERQRCLMETGLPDKLAASQAADETPFSQPLLDAYLFHWIEARVGAEAARHYADALKGERGSLGILGLVARTHDHWLANRSVSSIARLAPWTWRSGSAIGYLSGLLLLGVTLALVRAVLLFVLDVSAATATLEAATRMRRAIYHHTYRLGTLAIRALGPSEAVSTFTRHVESVHDGLYAWLTVAIREPVLFGLLLLFALAINFWLTVAFVVFALLVWLAGGQLAAYYLDQGRAGTRTAATQLALLQESLMLMRLVKCYLMELFNQGRVERQLKAYSESRMSQHLGEAIYRPLLAFLAMLAGVVLFYVTGLIVLDGRLGVAGAIVLVTSLVSLYWPLQNFLTNLKLLRRGRESAAILFEFLGRPADVGQVVGAEFLPPLAQRLEFDAVSLREPGSGRVLLKDVSLTLAAGQRVALVGPDELEKHALFYLIPRFLDPTSGEIRIDQHNLRWVTLDSLRTQIAVVLQHNLVFNDTVANNIGCGDTAYTQPQIIEAAKLAHAHHFIQKLPRGYQTPIGELGHALNVGEQFRVALARAILRDPALLLIEEPATVDDDTKALLDDTFARILPNRTVVFLPHRGATLSACDKVYLLHQGQIEASGTHRELLEKSDLYRHLYYLEFNPFAARL